MYRYITCAKMQRLHISLIIILMGNDPSAVDANTTVLDIPPRFQWENGHGFCGETSIQSISLYYGSYISQNQVLVGENAEQTLSKLGYDIESWNSQRSQPQYKDYLQWIKKNIKKGYPVIITGYQPKGDSDQYDHIYLALGARSLNFQSYSDDDILIYADLFDENYTHTSFGKVWDTRAMKNNGKELDFAIPKNVNYGIAVKGIKDIEEQFLPVQITLKENKEPNVSIGEQSVTFKLIITVSDLKQGTKYAVLRYDSYKQIPKDHVYASNAANVIKFTAEGPTYVFSESVESSKMVFYRCIEEQDLE